MNILTEGSADTGSARTGPYVLSTYLSPPAGRAFTTHRHDQSVALWHKAGECITLVRYWELERLTGHKHHEMPLYGGGSPSELIDYLLGLEGVKLGEVEAVWGTPGLDVGETLPAIERRELPLHSLGHLFSGLCMDSNLFQNATIVALALDAGPDYTLEDEVVGDNWYAGAVSRRGRVDLYPVESPGLLWQSAQRHFGQEPGTLMALAHATPAVVEFDRAVLLGERYWGGYDLMTRCFELLGSIIQAARRGIAHGEGEGATGFTQEELIASAALKVVQAASVEIVKRSVDSLLERAGGRSQDMYLSMSGGYALNCPTNSEIMDRYGFRGLLVPPCANDSGQALGIGLMGFFARGNLQTCHVLTQLPYAGEQNIDIAPARRRWQRRILDESDFDESVFVADLREHPIAWVDGAAEVGPRALGHRSLLGDPTQLRTKQILNDVKQRQWWRPVAPIVLEEHAAEWFNGARTSPFMLETFQVAQRHLHRVPAVVHIDGSARIQTLSDRDDEFLYRAVSAFHRATGVPIVCNTSLNDRGEPIANSVADAINFCVRKGISVAYIGRRRLVLDVESEITEATGPERRPLHDLYATQPTRPDAIYGEDADPQLMFLLYLWPSLHRFAEARAGNTRLRLILRHIVQQDPTFPERAEQFLGYWRQLLEGTIREGQVDAR